MKREWKRVFQKQLNLRKGREVKKIAMIVSVIAVGFSMNAWALSLGDAMPSADQVVTNVDGKSMKLEQIKGEKGTLVVFSCNACPWAKKWEGRIVSLGNMYAAKGVGVVMINSNDPKRNPEDGMDVMKQRHTKMGYKFPYVVDATSDIARKFDAKKTPEAFLFNDKGALVYHGAVDDNSDDEKAVKERFLKDAMDSLLAGKKIAKAETKAIGCTIKFR